jgi:hypothetical protein
MARRHGAEKSGGISSRRADPPSASRSCCDLSQPTLGRLGGVQVDKPRKVKAVKGVDSRDSKFPVARVISTSPDLIRIEYYATVKQAIAAGLNPRLAKKVFQDTRCNVPVFQATKSAASRPADVWVRRTSRLSAMSSSSICPMKKAWTRGLVQ